MGTAFDVLRDGKKSTFKTKKIAAFVEADVKRPVN
jgi:hypothetical protein